MRYPCSPATATLSSQCLRTLTHGSLLALSVIPKGGSGLLRRRFLKLSKENPPVYWQVSLKNEELIRFSTSFLIFQKIPTRFWKVSYIEKYHPEITHTHWFPCGASLKMTPINPVIQFHDRTPPLKWCLKGKRASCAPSPPLTSQRVYSSSSPRFWTAPGQNPPLDGSSLLL